jgi:BirA family transcriptional regulator, biotin operon repressor / biotin---[acetyl-CoA-carboxylase] ligase
LRHPHRKPADGRPAQPFGIGLNVNQKEFSSPQASSVSLHSGKPIDLAVIFDELLQAIEQRYFQVRNNRVKEIDDDYFCALYRVNESHRYIIDDREMKGTIRGVDVNGRLLVEIDNGIRSFGLKEIKYVY